MRVSTILDHPAKNEKSHSIADEPERGAPVRFVPSHLRRKPLVCCCRGKARKGFPRSRYRLNPQGGVLTGVQNMEFVHNSVISATKDNNEFLNSDGFVSVSRSRSGSGSAINFAPLHSFGRHLFNHIDLRLD